MLCHLDLLEVELIDFLLAHREDTVRAQFICNVGERVEVSLHLDRERAHFPAFGRRRRHVDEVWLLGFLDLFLLG